MNPSPPDHPKLAPRAVGVLLVNLGTPEATDYWSMRRYLKEFLSDRRVIETSRLIWWPVLNLIILSTRPQKKGRDYDAIWNRERNEGPLKTITRAQAEKLASRLSADTDAIVVDWAMRYGNPPSRRRYRRCRIVDATVFWSSRSIRNIRRRRRRRSATRRSRLWRQCAGSRRCASRRHGTTILPI